MELLGQCLEYLNGVVVHDIHLPLKYPFCQYCITFLRYEDGYKRYSCRLTGETIIDPLHSRGDKCPIQFKEE